MPKFAINADVALTIMSGTIRASVEDEYSRGSQTSCAEDEYSQGSQTGAFNSTSSMNVTQYDYYTPILEWMPTTKSESTQSRRKTTKGGKKVTLKLLYHKAVLFALNKFWDLKVHIRSMKIECNKIHLKKIEIQNLTKLLNDVTDIVNNQVDKLAEDAMRNVTLETMVDPVDNEIIKNISRHFQEMNSSTCELPAIESRQKLFNEVTAADEMLKSYYDKTSRYLMRVKSEILKSGAKFHNNTVLQKYCETSPYTPTESDTFNILRLKVD